MIPRTQIKARHGDVNLGPPNAGERRVRDRRLLEAGEPASPAKQVSSRLSKRLYWLDLWQLDTS